MAPPEPFVSVVVSVSVCIRYRLFRRRKPVLARGLASALGHALDRRMAKLYFHYSTMNAGKSTLLLQAAHNYREGGMQTYLITAQFDNRAGMGRIASRIGIGEAADTFAPEDDMFAKLAARFAQGPVACVFIDEVAISDQSTGLAAGARGG